MDMNITYDNYCEGKHTTANFLGSDLLYLHKDTVISYLCLKYIEELLGSRHSANQIGFLQQTPAYQTQHQDSHLAMTTSLLILQRNYHGTYVWPIPWNDTLYKSIYLSWISHKKIFSIPTSFKHIIKNQMSQTP